MGDSLLRGTTTLLAYNERPYDERGWCILEEGVAEVVVSHMQLQASQQVLPPRHAAAEASRPKLSLLGDDGLASPRLLRRHISLFPVVVAISDMQIT